MLRNRVKKIDTLSNFNLTEYIKKPWYIQKQQITPYLNIKDNYCVRAEYSVSKKSVPFYSGIVLNVNNYANEDMVNGKNINQKNNILCARIGDSNKTSKLLVGPCFLPNIFAGDYWVIDAGPYHDNYQWAIVSGGQPSVKYPDGCTTKKDSINNSGFWYFTRESLPNYKIIEKMNNISKNKGFTLSQLNFVNQSGCLYN